MSFPASVKRFKEASGGVEFDLEIQERDSETVFIVYKPFQKVLFCNSLSDAYGLVDLIKSVASESYLRGIEKCNLPK